MRTLSAAAKTPAKTNSAPAPQRPSAAVRHDKANPIWQQIAMRSAPTRVQAKLAVSSPSDPSEREADSVADHVMRMPAEQVQRKCACAEGGTSCPSCDAEQKTLQRSAAPVPIQGSASQMSQQGEAAPTGVNEVLAGYGRPLDPTVRHLMEQRFGYDFSGVRIHTGEGAGQSARNLNAHAYTLGHDIVFGDGRFVPETHEGQRLLAHELTHVVQQNNASLPALQRSAVSGAPASQGERPGEKITGKAPAAQPPSGTENANCPGYESGERSASHAEPGHLNPDVERLAPDKLLVADFGVDWRHVKSSTKSDSTLQSWLKTWESDDSYQLSIVGYSDCVGAEGLNTDLRQARASNVEALLGAGARSRVNFRGMAGLGEYVTANNSPANRARNRGVVIEFYQKFDFPEEEITVKPNYCGPDSTQWLVDQMNRNRDHPVIKTQRDVQWPNYIPFFNLGWNYGALTDFRDLVKAGGPWDFKSNQTQWRSGHGNTCPSDKCDKTVVLCGKCFFYDVPGNIHYGYIGRMATLRAWFLHNRASAAQQGGVDPPEDVTAIDIGIAMADQGATLCGEIAAHENELNREGTDSCGLCST